MARKDPYTSKWESLYQFRKDYIEKCTKEKVIDIMGYKFETNEAIYTMLDGIVKRSPISRGKNSSRKNK